MAACIQNATAQTSGGPDAYGYIWRNSNDPLGQGYNWIELDSMPTAVTVTGLADDNIRGPFFMQAPFTYYWYQPASFWIGSNGYIGFSSSPMAHPFPPIPVPGNPNNYLAAMATDLTFVDNASQPVAGASCKYWFSSGNDTLVVTWKDVPFWSSTAPGYTGLNTFQVVLSTNDSSILYQYQNQVGASQSAASFVSTGIENNSGNIGLQVLFEIYPTIGSTVKFLYPATTSLAINDASTTYCNNDENGGLFRSVNGGSYTSVVEVRNTGNQPIASFNSYSRVVNAANAIQVRDTIAVTGLAPAASQLVTFPDTWTPTIPGTYRHINSTLLAGDATPSNNDKTLELQAVDTTQLSILLSFDNGVDAGLGGLNWTGGAGGAAMHFVPPFTPCIITKVRMFIVDDPNAVGFYAMILDDTGPNGAPNNVLDSVFVDPASVVIGTWNDVVLTTPILLSSGSFYVGWGMGGDGVTLGQNQSPPVSNRTYEILGQASNIGNWASYRYREIEDVMINAYIEKVTGINETAENLFLSLYPNPASHYTNLSYDAVAKQNVSYTIFNSTGQQVAAATVGYLSGKGSIKINTSAFDNGIYMCVIKYGDNYITKKINIVR